MQLVISDSGLEFVKSFCLQLASHEPIDDRERESIKTFCELAPSLVAPFDEHSDPTHVTASAIVVGKPGVVLHLHKRLNMWLQPGGHIDSGESIHDAALREAREETGLNLQHFGAEKHLRDLFILMCTQVHAVTRISMCDFYFGQRTKSLLRQQARANK